MAFMPRTMPSVGCMRDAAHAAFADVLLHLADDVDRDRARRTRRRSMMRIGVVDRREMLSFGKLAVDGRSGHLDRLCRSF